MFIFGLITRKDRRLRRPTLLSCFVLTMLLGALSFTARDVFAQRTPSQSDPPVASLISISAPDANGVVTIDGAAGAVPAVAQVVIRNLFTEQLVYVNAGFNGSFSAKMFGPAGTPFWISTAREIPGALRNLPGSLPGGPGTIVRASEMTLATRPLTNLVIDADLSDWAAYPQASTDGAFALLNNESFYVGVRGSELLDAFASARLTFTITPAATYTVDLRPDRLNTVLVRQTSAARRDRGDFAANLSFQAVALEARFPAAIIDSSFETAVLTSLTLFDANGGELSTLTFNQPVLRVNEFDGPAYEAGGLRGSDAQRFFASGAVAQGASYWYADGRITSLTREPGDELAVELDVTLLTPTLPLEVNGLSFAGELSLQPVNVATTYTNNGWSNVLTPSGLAIDNLSGDLVLGTAAVDWARVVRQPDRLLFSLRFSTTLPSDLPADLYVPLFKGTVITPNGTVLPWAANSVLGQGTSLSTAASLTRLPLVINVGGVESTRLPMALFYDDPSEGSRGVLSSEDTGSIALSNRVRFDSPNYILPPGQYPVEPYLPNLMPNAYDFSLSPLIPFLFPSGRIRAQITRPDGAVENLGSLPILQNRLSTDELNERTRFGAQSPVDTYRLTTLQSALISYDFGAYGDYSVAMSANVEDIYGNSFTGGGTYSVTIAELLDLTPGVLPGTPFEVGDAFYPGVHLLPGYAADVTVTLHLYPLDGSDVVEQKFSGQANKHGHFAPADGAHFRFETPGQYVVDYEARFTDASGKLWAASMRSAGVVGSPSNALVAHGRRGLASYVPSAGEPRPAWFNTRQYPPSRGSAFIPSLLYAPYHRGDIAYYADSLTSGILPSLQVQDTAGNYAEWLRGTVPDYVSLSGETLTEAERRAALPLLTVLGGASTPYGPTLMPELIVNQAYSYFSAVRPGVTTRQFIQGGTLGSGLPLYWDAEDPLNRQIGAGFGGERPDDFTFLFGGTVVNNAEAGINEASVYAALGVVMREGDPLGPRVYPPYRGEAGGPDGGPLFTVRGIPYETFLVPTGTLPGQVANRGEMLVIAGQTAPTLHNRLNVTVTAPDGTTHTFEGLTNAIGYFYDPATALSLDQVGIWTVHVAVSPAGANSAGVPEPPLPVGSVIGALNNQFYVYVADPEAEPLTWNRNGDIDVPIPAGAPFNFTVNLPQGLQDVRVFRTTTMPGVILDDGRIANTPGTASYQFNPAGLAQEFLNLEANGRGSGASASDVVTITIAVSGTNANGDIQMATRTFYVLHDRIISAEGE